jgi:hypothetical protein
MAGLTDSFLRVWEEHSFYAVLVPGTRRVKYTDAVNLETAQRWLEKLEGREQEFRIARLSSYPFEEGGELWTVVVAWY